MSETPNAMLYQPKPVEINGTKYKRRRLGFPDEMKLVNMGIAALGPLAEGADVENMTASDAFGLFGAVLQDADTQLDLMEFLGSALQDFPLTPEEMLDGEKFPMGSAMKIVASVLEDADFEDFIDAVKRLWKLRTKLGGKKKAKMNPKKASRKK